MSEIKRKESWMNSKWRPAMGWMYMMVCVFDFILFPILWSIVQVLAGGEVKSQWQPITLQGAGLFHIAMGAVLGVTAWSRGQEKMAGATSTQMSYSPTSYQPPSYQPTGYRFANLSRPAEPQYPEI